MPRAPVALGVRYPGIDGVTGRRASQACEALLRRTALRATTLRFGRSPSAFLRRRATVVQNFRGRPIIIDATRRPKPSEDAIHAAAAAAAAAAATRFEERRRGGRNRVACPRACDVGDEGFRRPRRRLRVLVLMIPSFSIARALCLGVRAAEERDDSLSTVRNLESVANYYVRGGESNCEHNSHEM